MSVELWNMVHLPCTTTYFDIEFVGGTSSFEVSYEGN